MGKAKGFWGRLSWGREAPAIRAADDDNHLLVPQQSSSSEDVAKGTRLGSFSLLRCVAQGGQGELHLATDIGTGLPVAIKTVSLGRSEVACDRFMREAAAAAHLQHPDIVRSYAAGIDGVGDARRGWIAMEWVSGEDLGQILSSSTRPEAPAALMIGARVASALAYAHRHGVLHRDIKPGNILIQRRSGLVKLTDFGCAKMADAGASQSGVLLGSPAYMAPEQLAGGLVDGRSDLYAVGVLLFHALTGRLPFDSSSLGGLMAQIAQQPAPDLWELRPDLPKALGLLLAGLLAKQATDRPSDGDELARELCKMALACGLASPDDAAATRHNV
ncbi:MAG: serine/threonine-protein kinase [Ideonella sp.]|nr:serine/threonine-protein kinase [Ideonella sp.]